MKPFSDKEATYGNGTMISFNCEKAENVDEFYKIALENGGISENLQGPRHNEDYYTYVRDSDCNKSYAFVKIFKKNLRIKLFF